VSPALTVQVQKKFLNFKVTKFFVFLVMAKAIFYSPEMGASWEGEPPTVVFVAAALEEAARCLPFWAIPMVEILEKIWKKFEVLWVLKKAYKLCKTSDTKFVLEEDSQMMTVERPLVFL